MKEKTLFREPKSGRHSPAEETDEYIRVAGTGTGLILAAVLLLFAAAAAWYMADRIVTQPAAEISTEISTEIPADI